jgi:hypothetical protein
MFNPFKTMNVTKAPLLYAALCSWVALAAKAGVIIAPNDLSNAYGGAANVAPFDIGAEYLSSMRYQQMYNASQFSGIAPGGEYITQIAFRAASIDGFVTGTTLPDIQIDLSATPNSGLDSTFANNVGPNDTVVFNGAWSFSSFDAAGDPTVFGFILNLTTPFFYNPAQGNLLMDVRNIGGGSSTYFDDSYQAGQGVSRVYSSDVSSATGVSDNEGLVTAFTISTVPEPSLIRMAIVAGVFAISRGFRKRRLARE